MKSDVLSAEKWVWLCVFDQLTPSGRLTLLSTAVFSVDFLHTPPRTTLTPSAYRAVLRHVCLPSPMDAVLGLGSR